MYNYKSAALFLNKRIHDPCVRGLISMAMSAEYRSKFAAFLR